MRYVNAQNYVAAIGLPFGKEDAVITEILNSLSGVATVLLMIAVGVLLGRRGWITVETEDFLTKFALKISVPASLFASCVKYLGDGLRNATPLQFAVPAVTIFITIGLAAIVARVLKIQKNSRGVFYAIFAMSNTIFIGLPVCQAIFGAQYTPYIIIYYIGNTLIFWTLGVNLIARDGGAAAGLNRQTIKRIFSPAIMAFLLGLAVVLINGQTGFVLPKLLSDTVNGFGNMNTGLCMLVIGATVARMGWRRVFTITRIGAAGMVGRLLVSPLIVLAVCKLAGFSYYPSVIFAAEAGMPTMNQLLLVSRSYGADDKLAAQMLPATCICMIATLPAIIALAQLIF